MQLRPISSPAASQSGLASLARGLGARSGAVEGALAAVGEALGVDWAVWLACERGAAARAWGRRARPSDWDASWLRAVPPGGVRWVDALDRRRIPRLAVGASEQILVARPADGGALAIGAREGLEVEPRRALEAAGLVRRVAGLEREWNTLHSARTEIDLGRRAAAMVHDLRNQITLALLQLERARVEVSGAGEGLEALDELEGILGSARQLCADQLTGNQAGPVGERAEPERRLLRSILIQEARRAPDTARAARAIGVRVRCPRELGVRGPAGSLERLVHNLFVNAVEASFDGGDVRASAARLPDGRVELCIEDDGRGMDESELAACFDEGASPSANGTGYGTTSLVGALSDLGAEAIVESARGLGTRVRVLLQGASEDGARRAAVLVLDADPVRRSRHAQRLRRQAFAVREVSRPDAALRALSAGTTDALLVARGAYGEGLAALRAACLRVRILMLVVSAVDDWRSISERLAAALIHGESASPSEG